MSSRGVLPATPPKTWTPMSHASEDECMDDKDSAATVAQGIRRSQRIAVNRFKRSCKEDEEDMDVELEEDGDGDDYGNEDAATGASRNENGSLQRTRDSEEDVTLNPEILLTDLDGADVSSLLIAFPAGTIEKVCVQVRPGWTGDVRWLVNLYESSKDVRDLLHAATELKILVPEGLDGKDLEDINIPGLIDVVKLSSHCSFLKSFSLTPEKAAESFISRLPTHHATRSYYEWKPSASLQNPTQFGVPSLEAELAFPPHASVPSSVHAARARALQHNPQQLQPQWQLDQPPEEDVPVDAEKQVEDISTTLQKLTAHVAGYQSEGQDDCTEDPIEDAAENDYKHWARHWTRGAAKVEDTGRLQMIEGVSSRCISASGFDASKAPGEQGQGMAEPLNDNVAVLPTLTTIPVTAIQGANGPLLRALIPIVAHVSRSSTGGVASCIGGSREGECVRYCIESHILEELLNSAVFKHHPSVQFCRANSEQWRHAAKRAGGEATDKEYSNVQTSVTEISPDHGHGPTNDASTWETPHGRGYEYLEVHVREAPSATPISFTPGLSPPLTAEVPVGSMWVATRFGLGGQRLAGAALAGLEAACKATGADLSMLPSGALIAKHGNRKHISDFLSLMGGLRLPVGVGNEGHEAAATALQKYVAAQQAEAADPCSPLAVFFSNMLDGDFIQPVCKPNNEEEAKVLQQALAAASAVSPSKTAGDTHAAQLALEKIKAATPSHAPIMRPSSSAMPHQLQQDMEASPTGNADSAILLPMPPMVDLQGIDSVTQMVDPAAEEGELPTCSNAPIAFVPPTFCPPPNGPLHTKAVMCLKRMKLWPSNKVVFAYLQNQFPTALRQLHRLGPTANPYVLGHAFVLLLNKCQWYASKHHLDAERNIKKHLPLLETACNKVLKQRQEAALQGIQRMQQGSSPSTDHLEHCVPILEWMDRSSVGDRRWLFMCPGFAKACESLSSRAQGVRLVMESWRVFREAKASLPAAASPSDRSTSQLAARAAKQLGSWKLTVEKLLKQCWRSVSGSRAGFLPAGLAMVSPLATQLMVGLEACCPQAAIIVRTRLHQPLAPLLEPFTKKEVLSSQDMWYIHGLVLVHVMQDRLLQSALATLRKLATFDRTAPTTMAMGASASGSGGEKDGESMLDGVDLRLQPSVPAPAAGTQEEHETQQQVTADGARMLLAHIEQELSACRVQKQRLEHALAHTPLRPEHAASVARPLEAACRKEHQLLAVQQQLVPLMQALQVHPHTVLENQALQEAVVLLLTQIEQELSTCQVQKQRLERALQHTPLSPEHAASVVRPLEMVRSKEQQLQAVKLQLVPLVQAFQHSERQ